MNIKVTLSGSIKAKLILLFLLISLLPIAIIGFVSYFNSKKALQQSIENNLISVVHSRANHIDDFLTVSLDVVTSASGLSLFRENVYKLENGMDEKNALNTLDNAMEAWKANSNVFYRAKILDREGVVIATTRSIFNDIGADKSSRAYFTEGLKGPFIAEPVISPDEKQLNIAFSCPIYGPDSKTAIAVLVIHQAVDASLNHAKDSQKGLGMNLIATNKEGLGETGETLLADSAGIIFTKTRHPIKDSFFKTSTTALNIAKENKTEVKIFADYIGNMVIGTSTKLNSVGWVVIGKFDVSEAFAPVRKLGSIMLVLSAIILILVIVIALISSEFIVRPIVRLKNVAQAMSKGDLDQQISNTLADEIGQLTDSFITMQKSMRLQAQMAKEISEGNLLIEVNPLSDKDIMGISFKNMILKLRSQLKNIGDGINVLASSSSEITAAVTQLASSSAETATSVGETTSTIEEVKQTALVSNHKAQMVSDNSIRMAEISKEGNKAIANTIEGMNKIRQQMSAIASMVVRLSEQSQTIGEITTSVNELAEQSNLLAVNAAIEAAKAGEQGKGFTVVAQEIKLLANRSKEATAQVRSILRDVQKSISSAVMATEEGGKAVEEGIKLTNLSGDAIRTLSESVEEASNAAVQIAASSQQQLEGMDQVVIAMENIRESSMQAVTSTQQSVESVNELQKVGQKLDELMKQYKLGS